MKHIFDPLFKYTPAKAQGPEYLKKKFERIRREQEAKRKQDEANEREVRAKVETLPARKSKEHR